MQLVPNVDIDHELEEEPIVKYETPDSPIPRNDDEDAIDLAVKMQKLELAPSERRYIGKSRCDALCHSRTFHITESFPVGAADYIWYRRPFPSVMMKKGTGS